MVNSDRVAAIVYLLGFPTAFYAMGISAWDVWMRRPVVTKHPYTGQLHIPRSNLDITGEYRRRHGASRTTVS